MDAAIAACRTTPILLAANAEGCMPHVPNLFFMKPPKLLQVYYASTVFELSEDSRVFMKSKSGLFNGGQQSMHIH
jgi:hypothetical protein